MAAVGDLAASEAIETAPGPFAQLIADTRILLPTIDRDRTFYFALAIVVALHLAAFVATYRFGASALDRDRRGQVETSQTVTVELVEAPDAASTSKVSRAGETAPPTPPIEQPAEDPPQPPMPEQVEQQPQEAQPPRPEPPQPEPPKPKVSAQKPPPPEPPLSLEGFDVSMNDYAAAVDRQIAQRKANPRKADPSRIAGAAASGYQSAYGKSVIAALGKTKPQLAVAGGEIIIQFMLTRAGDIGYLRVVQSSKDKLLDQMAVDWIKRTKFAVPPPGLDEQELKYQIHWVVE
jgi:TonB family protein